MNPGLQGRAWRPEECVLVDGLPMVYHGIREYLVVRLPGGRMASLAELREKHDVILPRVFRHENETLPGKPIGRPKGSKKPRVPRFLDQ